MCNFLKVAITLCVWPAAGSLFALQGHPGHPGHPKQKRAASHTREVGGHRNALFQAALERSGHSFFRKLFEHIERLGFAVGADKALSKAIGGVQYCDRTSLNLEWRRTKDRNPMDGNHPHNGLVFLNSKDPFSYPNNAGVWWANPRLVASPRDKDRARIPGKKAKINDLAVKFNESEPCPGIFEQIEEAGDRVNVLVVLRDPAVQATDAVGKFGRHIPDILDAYDVLTEQLKLLPADRLMCVEFDHLFDIADKLQEYFFKVVKIPKYVNISGAIRDSFDPSHKDGYKCTGQCSKYLPQLKHKYKSLIKVCQGRTMALEQKTLDAGTNTLTTDSFVDFLFPKITTLL